MVTFPNIVFGVNMTLVNIISHVDVSINILKFWVVVIWYWCERVKIIWVNFTSFN